VSSWGRLARRPAGVVDTGAARDIGGTVGAAEAWEYDDSTDDTTDCGRDSVLECGLDDDEGGCCD